MRKTKKTKKGVGFKKKLAKTKSKKTKKAPKAPKAAASEAVKSPP